MNPINKCVIMILSASLLFSCDIMSDLLTTNYFEALEQYEPDDVADIDIDLDETIDWNLFSTEEKLELIEEYTDAVLSEESSDLLFEYFKEYKTYKNDVTNYYRELLLDTPDPDNNGEILLYQRKALALIKIEVFTTEKVTINVLEDLFSDYSKENEDELLTFDVFVSASFDLSNVGTTTDELTTTLLDDIDSLYRASLAINLLGDTIVDHDNPTSTVLSKDDGIYIMLSSFIGQILDNNTLLENDVDITADTLVQCIIDKDITSTVLIFPKDLEGNNSLTNYLGDSGALVFTATGYLMPSVSLFGGDF